MERERGLYIFEMRVVGLLACLVATSFGASSRIQELKQTILQENDDRPIRPTILRADKVTHVYADILTGAPVLDAQGKPFPDDHHHHKERSDVITPDKPFGPDSMDWTRPALEVPHFEGEKAVEPTEPPYLVADPENTENDHAN